MRNRKLIAVGIVLAMLVSVAMGSKSAFQCSVIPAPHYELKEDSIVFYISHYYDSKGPYGPYAVKVVSLERERFIDNNKGVTLDRRILFKDKKVSYADTLFLSKEGVLYECRGSP